MCSNPATNWQWQQMSTYTSSYHVDMHMKKINENTLYAAAKFNKGEWHKPWIKP